MRRHLPLVVGIALVLALAPWGIVRSRAFAQDARCFPETNQCAGGRFRQFWEQNGGLPVFGYPITPARNEVNPDDGKTYMTQWFERNRFELHPENQPPYDVLLGRLGAPGAAGVPPEFQQRESGPRPGCLWFEQTGFNVCDDQGARFASYWQSHGLADPALNAYQRSLALFGLPLTRQMPASTDGVAYVQYFERARFEWHPNNPDPYKVLLGLLGDEANPPSGGAPQPAAYDNPDTPLDMLASYYNAVNRQEYQRAYNYWQNPPSSYADFVQGYADTASVQLIVQPPTFIEGAAGSAYASIPTVLVATQRDGSQQLFAGCYATRKSNLRPPDIPKEDTWHLYSATIAPAQAGASIAALLAQACQNQQAPAYDNPNSPIDLLASFYDAVNRQEYQRAYGYWQNPPSSYADFVQGYADTASVQLIVQPPASVGAAAGSLYASIPTVLVATHRDGGQQLFAGCYVTRKANLHPPDIPKEDVWHLYSATIAPAQAGASIATLLEQGCPANQ
jgi:hypothetical protein